MSVHIGYTASKSAVAILNALPALTTITNFYAEQEDASDSDNNANTATHPCVICRFQSGQEYPMFTGNYNGTLEIEVELYDDTHTAAQKEAIYSDVFSRFSTDSICADLNAAAVAGGLAFTAFGFWQGIQQTPQIVKGNGPDGRRILSKSLLLPINCCAKVIT